MKKSIPTQVVILAGGKGERLMPLTANMNKGMVRVAGKPFLEHLIELFKKNGLKKFLILTGHAPESITDYFGNGKKWGVEILYQHTPAELNHGARFARAVPLLDDFFVLHRNDIYWPFDIKKHLARFYKAGAPAMMTVYRNTHKDGIYGPHNNIRLGADDFIERYDNLLSPDPFYTGQDLGFFLMTKKVVEENMPASPADSYCLHHGFFITLAEKGLLSALVTETPGTTTTDTAWLTKAEEYFVNLTKTQPQNDRKFPKNSL